MIEIADAAFSVQPIFESTRAYCAAYLTERKPDYRICVLCEELIQEQRFLDQEADEEGLKRRRFSDMFLERSVIQRKVARCLLERNVLLMHGSTVAVDGQAYLFTAPCGTGKSTHTRLWREFFADRAVMVNDDKPFLRIADGRVLAYGSPWSGKHGLATNVCVPLAGICFLNRGIENHIRRIPAEDGILSLFRHIHMPVDELLQKKALSLADDLAGKVPLWEMYCNKELDAAKVSYSAMRGEYI